MTVVFVWLFLSLLLTTPSTTAQTCVLSDIDTSPVTRDTQSVVCRSVQALSCCPLASQASIQAHIANRSERIFADSISGGACAFNAMQLLCASLCSVEQALVAKRVDSAPNSTSDRQTRLVLFPVDLRYVDGLWRSCRERCDRASGLTFGASVDGAAAFLALFDGVLQFDDHSVPLDWHFQFRIHTNWTDGPALLAAPTASSSSLARAPCGLDDTPCNSTVGYVSKLPSCDVPTTMTPRATTPATASASAPLSPSLADEPLIVPLICGMVAIFIVGVVGCVLLARQCAKPAEPIEQDEELVLDDDSSHTDDAHNRPRRRPSSASPARQVAIDRRRSAARRQSRRLAGDESSSDGDDAVNSMDSAASEHELAPPPCADCGGVLARLDDGLWCAACRACKRGICLYCGRTGRHGALFCRGCHKLLPGMLPQPDEAATDGIDCAICLESGFDEQPAVELPCKHILHRACFMQWFAKSPKHNNLCPICKQKLKVGAVAEVQ
jgi:hypothetical protein